MVRAFKIEPSAARIVVKSTFSVRGHIRILMPGSLTVVPYRILYIYSIAILSISGGHVCDQVY
ncbi:hypothetical protein MBAV_003776 [Candidatus Magnetobacterium bavaricum]|uniref:Uncharacterized protein n=1 Tax=Candidatus Magnetobacterium bavaricum TaxID=29290 RepID=A0A0F3GQ51_9BACT|nr:hypothetical protein MBAV_003776 [Candidatus Magnetobacterium bavaricum]